ncbi:transcriptional regulator, AsnC family [Cryptosporangium aurantiacum]|uniref:Transcriptional regulator, AsnC family n=1 Tax=Cryptosporangium aurantiacum TaxID=134849 RepID=A0A1M7HYQ5_9ACTN|nr:transcriptional regulator, AsnC family [Cryptosporangium aurantiacum]
MATPGGRAEHSLSHAICNGIRKKLEPEQRNHLQNRAILRDHDRVQPTSSGRSAGPPVVLDDIAKRIIEQLQRDGRRSYAAIAKDVGLSEAAVRQRIQRLLEAGVMQIVAVTDPLMLGFRRQAMVGVRAEGDLREVAERLGKLDEIDYVVLTAGSYDVLLEVVAEDDDHLLRVVNELIRQVPGVRSTEIFMYLRLVKQTYSWGTR